MGRPAAEVGPCEAEGGSGCRGCCSCCCCCGRSSGGSRVLRKVQEVLRASAAAAAGGGGAAAPGGGDPQLTLAPSSSVLLPLSRGPPSAPSFPPGLGPLPRSSWTPPASGASSPRRVPGPGRPIPPAPAPAPGSSTSNNNSISSSSNNTSATTQPRLLRDGARSHLLAAVVPALWSACQSTPTPPLVVSPVSYS